MEIRCPQELICWSKACLVAAQYTGMGAELTVAVDNSQADITMRTKFGDISGRTAIIRYIARLAPGANLEGRSVFTSGLVDQWVEITANELCYMKGSSAEAAEHVKKLLESIETHLTAETFLAGPRITVADIALYTTLVENSKELDAGKYLAIKRWMETCGHQTEFSIVLDANDDPQGSTRDVQGSSSRGLGMQCNDNGSGRGSEPEPRLLEEFDKDNAALDKIAELGIQGELFEHRAALTVDEQSQVLGSLVGEKTKNLFLKDKKAGLFLITVRHDRPTDTKTLAKLLGLPGKVTLRFADADTLASVLAVPQGAVGPLAVVNDVEGKAKLAMDKALLDTSEIISHPLRNDRSIRMKAADIVKFVNACSHEPLTLDFSSVKAPPPDPESVKSALSSGMKIDPDAAKKSVERAKLAAQKVKHERSDPSSKAGMKKETLLAITASKFDDFPTWYQQVITLSEMIDFYDISGCYILRPWAYQIWEAIQQWMDKEIKKLDVQNSYFPLFVTRRALEAEKEHIEGFAAEVAWVTKSGEKDLEEPIAVRPTSETIMYPAFSRWIRSHRDLPLKLNQWSNVVRWEFKNPTPFLRTREFLWQEGHTAHASFDEADDMVMKALNLYRRVYEELLAVPVIMGVKTEAEKFAGGHKTTTVEAYISGTGRAIQGATSHHLGQNFGKMFKIQYEDDKGNLAIPWQTSWGLTTRTLGVCVMCHGDDQGLVLPPNVAPLQVVIVPIVTKKASVDEILDFCGPLVEDLKTAGVRVKFDDRINYTAGWKFYHWEQKGVPVRLEVGSRDMENKQARTVRRDTGEKQDISVEGLTAKIQDMLKNVQANLLERARSERDEHLSQVREWKDFVPALNRNDIVLTPFCNETEWEDKVKKLSRAEALEEGEMEAENVATSVAAKTLCIPLDQPALPEGTPCFISGKPATCWVLWGRSY